MTWFEIKNWLELLTGLDRDSLHIYAGVAVQLAVAALFRRSLASLVPWFLVAAVAVANEYYDYALVPEASRGDPLYQDVAIKDIWNTLLLPSVLLVVARLRPDWLTGRLDRQKRTKKPNPATPSA